MIEPACVLQQLAVVSDRERAVGGHAVEDHARFFEAGAVASVGGNGGLQRHGDSYPRSQVEVRTSSPGARLASAQYHLVSTPTVDVIVVEPTTVLFWT